MAQFDLSVIKTFTIPGDTTNVYAMIDENIVTNTKAGLSAPQQAAVDAYRFTPTTIQLQGDPTATPPVAPVVPVWAGNQPVAVYFKGTLAQLQTVLSKYYK